MDDLEKKIQERIAQNEANKQSLVIFGHDMTKVPCFKQSCINGILSGVGAGIVIFMFTSRIGLATHSAMGTFGAVTLGYFSVCRYQFFKEKLLIDKMKGLMQTALITDGAERDEKIKEISKLVDI
ncbi:cytochrome c oxidase assembly protein COX20, mitochondrial [Diachasma alloeum]|uniref:cytochrome c oxidase assembly protein COX20, mitochondrial n=1 Tax=Diachasma alloeum TaxID=454923 RepID=UPI0007383252|nr:cytochrome c oxidase assembly protein COX20, mitochondrial [Diachasma alloeum]